MLSLLAPSIRLLYPHTHTHFIASHPHLYIDWQLAHQAFYFSVWMSRVIRYSWWLAVLEFMCATATATTQNTSMVPCRRPICGCFWYAIYTRPFFFPFTCLRDIHNNKQLKWESETETEKNQPRSSKKNYTEKNCYRKLKSEIRKYVFTNYSPLWLT